MMKMYLNKYCPAKISVGQDSISAVQQYVREHNLVVPQALHSNAGIDPTVLFSELRSLGFQEDDVVQSMNTVIMPGILKQHVELKDKQK